MKTDFNIYWVDDEPDVIAAKRLGVEEHLEDLKFNHNIVPKLSLEEGWISEVKTLNPYFVIMDYNLKENEGGGEKLIKELRDNGCYHEVIFYTSGGFEPAKLVELITGGGLEVGVSFVDKEESADLIKSMIDQKISEYSDLSTQRGWIVADSIELEDKLNKMLLGISGLFPQPFQDTMKRIVRDSIKADFGFRNKLAAGMLGDLVKFLRGTNYSKEELEKFVGFKEVFKDFSPEVVQLRNTIAHQPHKNEADKLTLQALQNGSPYAVGETREIIYDEAFLLKARSNFMKQSSNIDGMLAHISTVDVGGVD